MKNSLFEDLLGLIGEYRKRIAFAVFLVVLSNGLLVANPLIMRAAINNGKAPLAWGAVLLLATTISAILKYRMRIIFISISRLAEKKMRSLLFEKIQQQSMEFFNRHGVGELMSRLTNDIAAYRDVLGPGVMYPIYFSTLAFPGLIAMAYISPSLTMYSLVPLLLIPLLNVLLRQTIYMASYKVQEKTGVISNRTQEVYSGIRIVKSYGIEKVLSESFQKMCNQLAKVTKRRNLAEGIFYPFLTLITKLITVGLVLGFGYMQLQEGVDLSAADFASFMWLQSYIFFPILMFGWVLPLYQQGRAAYDRLKTLYNEPNAVSSGHTALKIPEHPSIECKDLTFFYPGASKPSLHHLNLKIPGGTFIGLTGPTGSGKTTLLRLIERQYEVERGTLFINGYDVRDYPLSAFSEAIASVEQIPFLFSKTIAENVGFGKLEATQAELEMVAENVSLHDTIMEFPAHYNTIVGERGVTLSGGQRQRVALARAFLVDRELLLLDDIFSAVDARTEQQIFERMLEHLKGKTVVLVTHRVSILEKLPRVLYMKEGQIVEDGAPDELVKASGHFAALVELQREQKWQK